MASNEDARAAREAKLDELHEKLQQHFTRERPVTAFNAGYSAEDIATVFGE